MKTIPEKNALDAVEGEWFVYVHERGHMIHNSLYNFGNAVSYTLITKESNFIKTHEVNRKEVTYLNDPKTPCQSRKREEDMNICIQHYIENKIGCQLPWYENGTNLPKCSEKVQYQSFLDAYDEIASLSGFSIATKTGCLPSCKINEFTISIVNVVQVPNVGAPTWGGQFFYPGGRYIKKVYHYNYDFTSYIADVGGLVGLFLGYSMLSFYDGLKSAWRKIK